MLPLIFSAALVSLAGAITPGPILAVVIAKGIKSPWAGLQIALAHIIVDISLILFIYFGLGDALQSSPAQIVFGILGGLLVIWMGIKIFRSRNAAIQSGGSLRYNAFFLGFIVTLFNPMFLPWWLTVGSMFIMKFRPFGAAGLAALILAMEIPNIVWYPLASAAAYRSSSLKHGQKIREWLFILCGLSLVGFGVWFLVSGIQAASA